MDSALSCIKHVQFESMRSERLEKSTGKSENEVLTIKYTHKEIKELRM